MKRIISLIICLVLIPSFCFAAGSAYVTVEKINTKTRVYQVAWTSDGSGDVNGTSFQLKGGIIFKIASDPETGVTADLDFTLPVQWNIATSATTTRTIEWADALSGVGVDLSNSVNGEVIDLSPQIGVPTCTVTPTISGAGATTSGTLLIYVWEE